LFERYIQNLFHTVCALKKTMLRILMILLFICLLDLLSARPAEELTKFTFDNIQNNTENIVFSKLDEAKVKFYAFRICLRK